MVFLLQNSSSTFIFLLSFSSSEYLSPVNSEGLVVSLILLRLLYLCLCLADGVALGAAVASSQVSVQVIVFFAVILHKVGHMTD